MRRLVLSFFTLTRLLAWLLGLSAVALFAAFIWLTATESGCRWWVGQLDQRLPQLTVVQVQGNLWQGLRLTGVQWRSADGMRLQAQQAGLTLAWAPFWQFRFDVDALSLRHVRVTLPPGRPAVAKPAQPAALPEIDLPLPVSVTIRALSVDDLRIAEAGESQSRLAIPRLRAQVQAQDGRVHLHLSEGDVQLPDAMGQTIALSLRGRAAMVLSTPNLISTDLDVLAVTRQGWLDSQWRISGSLVRPAVHVTASWTGFDGPSATVAASARIRPTEVELTKLAIDTLGGSVCGRGRLDWTQGLEASLHGTARALSPDRLLADLGQPPPSEPSDAPRSTGTGFDWTVRYAAAAADRPQRLDWVLSRLTGRLAGVGFSDLRLDGHLQGDQLEARIEQGRMLDGDVAAKLSLGLAGTRPVSAQLGLSQVQVAPLLGLLRHLGLVRDDAYAKRADGSLNLAAHLDGRLGAQTADRRLNFSLDSLRGQLAFDGVKRPVQARLHASLAGRDRWHDAAGRLQLGSTRLDFSGGLAARQAQLTASVQAPKLGDFPWPVLGLPALQGAVAAHLAVDGFLSRPGVKLDLKASDLSVRQGQAEILRVGSLKLAVSSKSDIADWRQAAIGAKLDAAAIDLPQAKQRIDSLSMIGDGSLARQRTRLTLTSGERRLRLELEGGWRQSAGVTGSWQGQLSRLALHDPTLGEVQLQKPAKLALAADRQTLGTACLQHADSHLCLSGAHAGAGGQLNMTGDAALSLLRPWLPPDLSLPGRAKLTADLAMDRQGAMTGHLAVNLPDNAVVVATADGPQRFDYQGLGLTARLADKVVNLDLKGHVDHMLVLDGQGTVGLSTSGPAGGQPLALTLRLRADDLKPIAPLLAQFTDAVANPAGAVTGRLSLSGTLGRPKLGGQLSATGLAFDVPATGVAYHDGTLDARIDAANRLTFNGSLRGEPISGQATSADANQAGAEQASQPSVGQTKPEQAKSGQAKTVADKTASSSRYRPSRSDTQPPGQVAIDGSADLAHLPHWRINAEVIGNTVPVLAIPTLTAWASPDLALAADQAGARVRGSVLLPKVLAHVEKLPDSAVEPSADVVIEGRRQLPKPPVYPIRADIRVRLGDAVRLSGMGFSSRLGGGVKLQLRSGNPVAAFGEINLVDGRYQAYGQSLAITNGRLIFAGPVNDPGLAVTASRKVGDTEVGLKIGGTLHDPKTGVFSSPSLPESEALSLLLTGRKLNDSNAADGALLLAAVSGLGITQGENITRDIGQTLGLDEIGFDSTGNGSGLSGTRLTLGKRIGNRLFVRYAIGVLNGVGELITRYKLNRFLDVEVTAAPAAQGGDLIYHIEQGKPEQDRPRK